MVSSYHRDLKFTFAAGARDYQDDIPTRDIGPDRLIGHSSNHSEIGLPISTSNDNRSR